MNATETSSLSSNRNGNLTDRSLLLGLNSDDIVSNQLANTFWEIVWPKLEEIGWEKKLIRCGGDSKGSTVLTTRKDLDVSTSEEGKDYYTCIKDVIERINLRLNVLEAALADRYRRAISNRNYRANLSPMKRQRNSPTSVDLSWKEGRKYFPKKSSMVGEEYQVSILPSAGSYEQGNNSDQYELIWDPFLAKERGLVLEHGKDVISSFRYNLREAALLELSRLDYNADLLQSDCAVSIKTSDGSEWSKEQKEKFHVDIFRFRRNLPAVAKSMDVPMKSCHAYYLGTYKSTPEYTLLKSICVDERHGNSKDSQPTFDVCAICGDGGKLIICDGCEGEYHISCLNPPLRVVPEGHWMCDDCVNLKALKSRDFLLEKSKLFEKTISDGMKLKKRNFSELQLKKNNRMSPIAIGVNADGSKVEFFPSEPFRDAVTNFTLKINRICRRSIN